MLGNGIASAIYMTRLDKIGDWRVSAEAVEAPTATAAELKVKERRGIMTNGEQMLLRLISEQPLVTMDISFERTLPDF